MDAYGWHVQEINGHDYNQISSAIESAQSEKTKPSVIICNTTIGYGSPNKAGSHDCHGAPLGDDEVLLSKKYLGISKEKFFVCDEVKEIFIKRNNELKILEDNWNILFNKWQKKNQDLYNDWKISFNQEIPDLDSILPNFETGSSLASRASSGQVIQSLAENIPYLVGGSADLAPSNNTCLLYTSDAADE